MHTLVHTHSPAGLISKRGASISRSLSPFNAAASCAQSSLRAGHNNGQEGPSAQNCPGRHGTDRLLMRAVPLPANCFRRARLAQRVLAPEQPRGSGDRWFGPTAPNDNHVSECSAFAFAAASGSGCGGEASTACASETARARCRWPIKRRAAVKCTHARQPCGPLQRPALQASLHHCQKRFGGGSLRKWCPHRCANRQYD